MLGALFLKPFHVATTCFCAAPPACHLFLIKKPVVFLLSHPFASSLRSPATRFSCFFLLLLVCVECVRVCGERVCGWGVGVCGCEGVWGGEGVGEGERAREAREVRGERWGVWGCVSIYLSPLKLRRS
ncbi:hypothetical protein HCDSEM_052 [Candidatus Hodgkinia cicadicola Dsem]|nr:hypothetical protein HCDSEM_052 [Candidatus Hodgkinia cicadicola Dsem]